MVRRTDDAPLHMSDLVLGLPQISLSLRRAASCAHYFAVPAGWAALHVTECHLACVHKQLQQRLQLRHVVAAVRQ